MTSEATTPTGGATPSGAGPLGRVRDRAQLGLCAALALAGVVVVVDASRLGHVTSSNDPIGPRAMPFVVGGLLSLLNPAYMRPLFDSSTGRLLLALAAALVAAGGLWLRRVVVFRG